MNIYENKLHVNLGKLWEMVRDREAWHPTVHGVARNWTQLGDWTTTWKQTSKNDHWGTTELCWVIFLPTPSTCNFQILTQREKERESKINRLQVEWSWLQTHLTISDRFAGCKGHNQTHQSHMSHKGIFLLKLIQQNTSWRRPSNSLASLLEVSGDGSVHARARTHTHTHTHTLPYFFFPNPFLKLFQIGSQA